MRHIAAFVGAFAVGVGLSSSALAAGDSGNFALLTQIFGHPLSAGNAHACFQRAYDQQHLKSHPQQNVRTMTLLVTGDSGDPNAPEYTVGLDVRFRTAETHFQTYGSCWSVADEDGETASSIGCGIDCDGGEIDVKLKDDKTVLVGIPDGARLWDPNSQSNIEEEEGADARGQFGEDDKLFRLDRTGLTDCLPLATDDDEKAQLQAGK